MSDEKTLKESEQSSIEVLLMLQATECQCAYDVINENMDIDALSPSDKNIINKLKTAGTLHRIQNRLTELKEVIGQ